MGWNGELAHIWTKMVGPSRPTVSELAIYTKYAHRLMNFEKRRLRMLVLGSTPEFRDWGYEENFEVWVMDINPDYNNAINRELRHKVIIETSEYKEHYICEYWQNLSYENYFDIIIGDLAIGNIPPEQLEEFIEKIGKALTPNGLFLGKSFFVPKEKIKPIRDVIKDYYSGAPYHPYSALSFYLTMHSLDKNNLLSFQDQYNLLISLHREGLITSETLKHFKGVGWDSEMKFKFHVPNISDYEKLLNKYLKIHCVEYGEDVYSNNFPLYIVTKQNSKCF
ncbi:MAG: hypothetical protein IKJ74_06440 [Clostridia bacterium]|nr:hypothetical protein [Clostridia bacterium]